MLAWAWEHREGFLGRVVIDLGLHGRVTVKKVEERGHFRQEE